MNNEKQLNDILADQIFVKSLMEMKTSEEAQAALREKGIEIESSDLTNLGKFIGEYAKGQSNQLSSTQLENIVGGATSAKVRYAGRVISFPFSLIGYSMGAIVAGLPRGFYDGFRETWWYSESEDKSDNAPKKS